MHTKYYDPVVIQITQFLSIALYNSLRDSLIMMNIGISS